MKKVVIDCDPGIDDAMALLMAFASDEIDVLGITAVSGNVPVENTAENALALTELAGQDIEVAAGACKPLSKAPHHAYHVHGDNGLGGVSLPAKGKLSSSTAVELLIDRIKAHPGEIEIIALGPLTNIALLLKDYPEAVGQIKKIIIMGGALKGGNATDFAEFNIYADPHAADIVFTSGVPVDMYGLDATNRVLLSPEEVKGLASMGGKVLTPLAKMLDFYLSFYKSV
ncbi:MAG: nucleoside hydrolase, partial [Spirochaetales bacterium]|nr:nucleoside hydrolase [Spirochaetales bacterium]